MLLPKGAAKLNGGGVEGTGGTGGGGAAADIAAAAVVSSSPTAARGINIGKRGNAILCYSREFKWQKSQVS